MLDIKQLQHQHVRFPLPLLTLAVASLLVAGCDDYDSYEDDQALDAEVIGEEEPNELELEAWDPDAEPYSVVTNWVGGSGGNFSWSNCPIHQGEYTTAVGIAAAPTPNGSLVRQLALVCEPEFMVESAQRAPTWLQPVVYSGYSNDGYLISSGWTSRSAWDASAGVWGPLGYKADNTRYAMCDPGYRVSKIDVRAGAYVDRVNGVTCWWDGPGYAPQGRFVYFQDFRHPWENQAVYVGGNGGSYDTSSCQSTSEKFADGIQFRSAAWLDGFALICEE